MRAPHSHLALLTAVITLIAATPATIPGTLSLREGSRLWFEGTSTVRSWNCSADRIDAKLSAADEGVIASVLDGKKVAGQVQVDFPVQKLECKNGTMNEHMLKALKAKEFATIHFSLDSYDLARGESVTGTLQGTLQLAGQTLPISIPAQFAPAADGAMRVTGKVPVKMTDWGIKPPTLMLGAMKVGPVVTVHFDLLLQKGSAVALN
ncbi:MAG: YceI family protein [Gemmatimonadaceae bacterium]|nr:YceI family protein [Gemmatimonadaceae bacterium]